MKIIFGESRDAIAEHARKYFEARDKSNERYPDEMRPKGIAYHTARFPIVCEDCGETYWANDPYTAHTKCGSTRRAGFS